MALVSAANVIEIAAMAIHTPVWAGLGRGCSTTGGAAGVGGPGGCAGGEATVVTGASVTARSPERPRPAFHNPPRGRRSRCRTRWDPALPPAVVPRNCRRGVARWWTTRARSLPTDCRGPGDHETGCE